MKIPPEFSDMELQSHADIHFLQSHPLECKALIFWQVFLKVAPNEAIHDGTEMLIIRK